MNHLKKAVLEISTITLKEMLKHKEKINKNINIINSKFYHKSKPQKGINLKFLYNNNKL